MKRIAANQLCKLAGGKVVIHNFIVFHGPIGMIEIGEDGSLSILDLEGNVVIKLPGSGARPPASNPVAALAL